MAPTAGFEPASFSLFGNPSQTGVTVPNAGPGYTMWAFFLLGIKSYISEQIIKNLKILFSDLQLLNFNRKR